MLWIGLLTQAYCILWHWQTGATNDLPSEGQEEHILENNNSASVQYRTVAGSAKIGTAFEHAEGTLVSEREISWSKDLSRI